MPILPLFRAGCAMGALCLALPAAAQPAAAPTQPQNYHDQQADIIVTAIIPRRQGDILSGTSVISGAELTRALRPTIGETLAHQPGVSATSFGPNASRPVLRGFQGERVRILTDGIGSFDVSNTSVDHAVAINPLTADRIEVLRGPAALLYGSSAIGGVVNVIDSRIPRRVPDEPIHVDGIATYGSAADERTGSAEIEVPVSDKIVVHFDGSYSKSGDLDTGAYLLT
ncbi:MAG TPA: TonB-dependent receptor plug domain-containing protein, partial [Sphingobium sp.]|nr:TonB-dependent receptor plug domain-containing protein [Sphingobium sp.]